MNKFHRKLKNIRNSRKITQGELAKALGVSRSTIGMYESGVREPNFEMLEAIADYFNINMSDLIDSEKEAPSSSFGASYGTAIFRKRLDKELQLINRADTDEIGFDLNLASSMASGESQVTLDDACIIADELGHSLDYMVGLKDEEPVDNGKLLRFIELFTALSDERQVQAEDYLRYLAALPAEQ